MPSSTSSSFEMLSMHSDRPTTRASSVISNSSLRPNSRNQLAVRNQQREFVDEVRIPSQTRSSSVRSASSSTRSSNRPLNQQLLNNQIQAFAENPRTPRRQYSTPSRPDSVRSSASSIQNSQLGNRSQSQRQIENEYNERIENMLSPRPESVRSTRTQSVTSPRPNSQNQLVQQQSLNQQLLNEHNRRMSGNTYPELARSSITSPQPNSQNQINPFPNQSHIYPQLNNQQGSRPESVISLHTNGVASENTGQSQFTANPLTEQQRLIDQIQQRVRAPSIDNPRPIHGTNQLGAPRPMRPPIEPVFQQRPQMFEQRPQMNPVFEQRPQMNPVFEQRPQINPAFEQRPQMNPAFEQRPQMNPAFEQRPQMNPAFEQRPQMEPIFEQFMPISTIANLPRNEEFQPIYSLPTVSQQYPVMSPTYPVMQQIQQVPVYYQQPVMASNCCHCCQTSPCISSCSFSYPPPCMRSHYHCI